MSSHIDTLKVAYTEGYKAGERIGQQCMMDCTMIYLHRQGWGAQRIKQYFEGVNAIIDEYAGVFKVTQE